MLDIINYFQSIFIWVINLIHSFSSLIAGGDSLVKGLVTVTVISSLAFLGKKLPQQLKYYLLRNISTLVTYEKPKTETEVSLENQAYQLFASELAKKSKAKSFNLYRKIEKSFGNFLKDDFSFGAGSIYGTFFNHGKLYLFNRYIDLGDKVTPAIDVITVRVFFGTKEDILMLIPKAENDPKRYFYAVEKYGDHKGMSANYLNEELSIFLPSKLKEQIDKAVDYFLENKLEMLSRGMPWKLTFMFYGPPGTGKTTLISYIAKKLNRSIAMISEGFCATALGFANKNNAILALEDLDANESFHKRIKSSAFDDPSLPQHYTDNSLSTLLNFLQGAGPLNGNVTIITTNHLEKLDPAIYRPGRVDEKIFVGYYGIEDLKDWVTFFYRDLFDEKDFPSFETDISFRPADLSELYKKNPKDIKGFYKALKERCLELKLKTEEELQEIELDNLLTLATKAEAKISIKKLEESNS